MESMHKVEKMVAEMQSEKTKTLEELETLKKNNKSLVTINAHDSQYREELLRETSKLKAKVAELTPRTINLDHSAEESDSLDDDDCHTSLVDDFSLSSAMHRRTQKKLMQKRHISSLYGNYRFDDSEHSDGDLDRELWTDEDDISY